VQITINTNHHTILALNLLANRCPHSLALKLTSERLIRKAFRPGPGLLAAEQQGGQNSRTVPLFGGTLLADGI
jgi:hypothetical protein